MVPDCRFIMLWYILQPDLTMYQSIESALQWRHNGHDSVSNHQPRDCLLSRLIRRWSKKTSKLRVTDLCAGISPVTGEFPAQGAISAENVSIWWRHHGVLKWVYGSQIQPARWSTAETPVTSGSDRRSWNPYRNMKIWQDITISRLSTQWIGVLNLCT